MIRYLTGTLHQKNGRSLILLIGGVGYHVTVPETLKGTVGETLALWIHTHVREDTLALYGFLTPEELSFFEQLLTVNGIGPKMAMEIMNQPTAILQNAILSNNLPALTRIPGVGKKLAERLILELKGKITLNTEVSSLRTTLSDFDEDAIAALESLGYKRHHIQKVFSELNEELTTEERVRVFLQRA